MTALEYYQLREQPFGVTPDFRYLFLTPTQKEALNSIIYGIESGCGFVALIARPGLGKTTLLFQAFDILREKACLVFLFQTISTPLDLLRALLSGLGVEDVRGSLLELQINLRALLTEHSKGGKRVVLVIDEAQNLDDSVLELIRMLSNFETASDKLIQIILAGQPQLAENIASPELLQLRQRVSIFARLKPFTPEETALYVAHRLRVAGYGSDMPLFTRDALALIAQASEGIPRNINNFCFNALSLGCALQQKPIDRNIVSQVMANLDIGQFRKKFSHPVPQQEKVTLKSAPIPAKAKRVPALFPSLHPKVTFAIVALLVVVGSVFVGHDWSPRPAAAQPATLAAAAPPVSKASVLPLAATVEPPPPAISAPPVPQADGPAEIAGAAPVDPAQPAVVPERDPALTSSSAEITPPASDSPGLVRVTQGQTLLGICAEKFGGCTAQILHQIHQLNPSLSDLDHIEIGQQLRVPVLAAQSNTLVQHPGPTP